MQTHAGSRKRRKDASAPKLSRSEFWRVRGGQSSYRLMQDKFYETVGRAYGLERGEVGSDRQHKATAVFKQEQLAAETEALKEKIKPYEELQTQAKAVDAVGRTILPGVQVARKKSLATVKEQAKAYAVNRTEIASLRERATKLDKREQAVQQRERQVAERETRQAHLNELLATAESHNISLERENASLRDKLSAAQKSLHGAILRVWGHVRELLRFLRQDPQASRRADEAAEWAARTARADGVPDVAESIERDAELAKVPQQHRRGLSR